MLPDSLCYVMHWCQRKKRGESCIKTGAFTVSTSATLIWTRKLHSQIIKDTNSLWYCNTQGHRPLHHFLIVLLPVKRNYGEIKFKFWWNVCIRDFYFQRASPSSFVFWRLVSCPCQILCFTILKFEGHIISMHKDDASRFTLHCLLYGDNFVASKIHLSIRILILVV